MIEVTTLEYSELIHAKEMLNIISLARRNMEKYQFVDFIEAIFPAKPEGSEADA